MITFLLASAGSYILGGFVTGYYLVRYSTRQDIRQLGSGSAGARKVGRVLGRRAAVITFIADAVKGGVAVWLATFYDVGMWGIAAAMIAVICGHIWPAQLQFRGGKGVATSIGAVLALDFRIALTALALFVVSVLISRRFTSSGLLAITLCPIIAFLFHHSLPIISGLTGIAAVVLLAHRSNIKQSIDSPALSTHQT